MENIEIQKELLKSRIDAHFLFYRSGNLYYTVDLENGRYQFPICTVETHNGQMELSSDLGTTDFECTIKASLLTRWIKKANDNKEFIKIN